MQSQLFLAFLASTWGVSTSLTHGFRGELPLVLVIALSLVTGLIMVVIFGYASDQQAIHLAKDRIKAHLLAIRLFQDQPRVVLRSSGLVLLGTVRYLRLALKPVLILILPLTLLIMECDRYLGLTALQPHQEFLVTAHTADPQSVEDAALKLPPDLSLTAPPVHIASENEIIWRVMAEKNGVYDLHIEAAGQSFSKRAVVSSGLARLSPVRLRGDFLRRVMESAEPALPKDSAIESIAVSYPSRSISFVWVSWNWIWLFFVLSLGIGFLFKSLLGIEI